MSNQPDQGDSTQAPSPGGLGPQPQAGAAAPAPVAATPAEVGAQPGQGPAVATGTSAARSPTAGSGADAGRGHKVALLFYLVGATVALLWRLVLIWPEDSPVNPTAVSFQGSPSNVVARHDGPANGEANQTGSSTNVPVPATGKDGSGNGKEPELPASRRLLLICTLSGAMGALVHAMRSFYWYTGNRCLKTSWLLMYYLLPLNGALLAVVFYFVLRGGLTTGTTSTEQLSSYGFAALSALVGLFSPQAIEKLKTIAEQVFAKPVSGADAKPGGTVH